MSRSVKSCDWKSEADFAAVVVQWLQGQRWEVYQEVQIYMGDCIADIVAVQGPLVWTIETKLNFGMNVIEQALKHRNHSHFVSIATPESKTTRGTLPRLLLEPLGIGLLTTGWSRDVQEHIEPVYRRFPNDRTLKAVRAKLTEAHKTYCNAGSSRGGYYTPFAKTCDEIRQYVKEHPGCTVKELVDNIPTHYLTTATARCSIAKYITMDVIKGIRGERNGRAWRLYLDNGGKAPVLEEVIRRLPKCGHTDQDICPCDCHRYPDMRHIVACCGKCDDCGRLIPISMLRIQEGLSQIDHGDRR